MANKHCVVLRKTEDTIIVDSVLTSTQSLTEEEWQELVYMASDRVAVVNDVLYYEDEENLLDMLAPWEVQYGREQSSVGKFLARMNKDVTEVEFTVAEYDDA